MEIISSTINAHVYIEIPDNFLIALIENWFGDDEVILKNDNTSRRGARRIKTFT